MFCCLVISIHHIVIPHEFPIKSHETLLFHLFSTILLSDLDWLQGENSGNQHSSWEKYVVSGEDFPFNLSILCGRHGQSTVTFCFCCSTASLAASVILPGMEAICEAESHGIHFFFTIFER